MQFSEASQLWLEYLEAVGRAPVTIQSYGERLGWFGRQFGGRAVGDVTSFEADKWLLGLRRQVGRWVGHPYTPADGEKLSATTINNRAQAVQRLYKFLVTRGVVAHSPVAHWRLAKPKVGRPKHVEQDDMRLLVRAARGRAARGQGRDVALFHFMLDTGCRAGEVASALLKDWDGVGSVWVVGKTGGRLVFVKPSTALLINQWLVDAPQSAWLFCGLHLARGQQMTINSIYLTYKRRANDAGVSGRRNPHGVRHLVGVEAVRQFGLRDAQLLLGHDDINSTIIYAGVDEQRQREVVNTLFVL